MAKYTESVMQTEYECFNCLSKYNLEVHHCLSGIANREKSEKLGLKIWLCARCHRLLHDNKDNRNLEKQIKQAAQRKFEELYGTREDFIREFGKSYL